MGATMQTEKLKKATGIILGIKALRLAGGSLRLTMGGIGAAIAAMLLWERIKGKNRR
jgi:hypothetical protein